MLSPFPLTCFALGCLPVVGDVAFQAPQGGMPAKAFQVHLGVVMSCTQTDGCMAELVEIPVRGIAFPERINLSVRETRVAISVGEGDALCDGSRRAGLKSDGHVSPGTYPAGFQQHERRTSRGGGRLCHEDE